LKRLLGRGQFVIPDEIQKAVEGYIKEHDSVEQFLES